jgi:hypothetical protein
MPPLPLKGPPNNNNNNSNNNNNNNNNNNTPEVARIKPFSVRPERQEDPNRTQMSPKKKSINRDEPINNNSPGRLKFFRGEFTLG